MSHLHKKNLLFNVLFSMVITSLHATGEGGSLRIVTVGGAATEIVCALGAGDDLVAVDLSSTYPPKVRALPQIGYIRNISPEGILSMRPDIVVAVESLGPPAAKAAMQKIDLPVVWIPEPAGYATLEQSVNAVAKALDRPENAKRVLTRVREALGEVRAQSINWSDDAPRVLFFLQPPGAGRAGMAGGKHTRADVLIGLAGGQNAAGFHGFKDISNESLIAMNPDVIFIAISDGHGGSPESVDALRNSEMFVNVRAVQNGQVYGVPLDDLVMGPRLGEAAIGWNQRLAQSVDAKPAADQ